MANCTALSDASICKSQTNEEYIDVVPCYDQQGHLICIPGQIINAKYKVIKNIGKGYFGRVVQVVDIRTNVSMALKISKNKQRCVKAALAEIKTLKCISHRDITNSCLCNKMITSFKFNGHVCIGFEELGEDIYHFMKKNDFCSFQMVEIRHIAYQLCYAVNFLHQGGIIHTDLKPDNVLFVNSSYTKEYNADRSSYIRLIQHTDIRLIDFGCAIKDATSHRFTISNRNYRAPEVVFQAGWSYPVDVWSIACILYELFTGNVLLDTDEDDLEHCAIMEKVLGSFPPDMAVNPKYFTNGQLNFDWSTKPLEVHCHQPLRKSVRCGTDNELQFFDLMEKMLMYQPAERITLEHALQHPFFENLPAHQRIK